MTSAFAQRNLEMQGFSFNLDPALGRIAPWLRMTPSLSTAWIMTGTALASPAILLGFAATSAFGASRRTHPFDALHRGLPENPPPRRFAMGLAAAWAATTALLFAAGARRAGSIAGALLGLAGATVASTHFCVGSFIYRSLGLNSAYRPTIPLATTSASSGDRYAGST